LSNPNVVALPPKAAPAISIHFPDPADYLSQEEVSSLTPAILRERTEALKPMIAARARDTELARRPLDDVWSALRRTGIFYHFVPRAYGGLEFGMQDLLDVMLPVAEACASTGWVATFCVEHMYIFTQFSKEAQDEIYAQAPYILFPGLNGPPGRARKAPGGYIVNAHWKWGSGVMNADWVMGQCFIEENGEIGSPPNSANFMLSARDVTVLDTWHMAGMCGTGSNDIVIQDVFVPEHRVLAAKDFLNSTGPGTQIHTNPLYRIPIVPFTSITSMVPALGAARAAVDRYRRNSLDRVVVGGTQKSMDRPAVQLRLSRADILARTAEMLVREACDAMTEACERGDQQDSALRRRIRAQNAYAMTLCRDAITLVMAGSGAGAHSLDNPLQRYQRDVNMVSGHALYDIDLADEAHGRALFGLEPNSPIW
jgi:3-hydroxy-9,10-secoandrosta-1,3,5(10)-triene-9,17-dione monooxygenase